MLVEVQCGAVIESSPGPSNKPSPTGRIASDSGAQFVRRSSAANCGATEIRMVLVQSFKDVDVDGSDSMDRDELR